MVLNTMNTHKSALFDSGFNINNFEKNINNFDFMGEIRCN